MVRQLVKNTKYYLLIGLILLLAMFLVNAAEPGDVREPYDPDYNPTNPTYTPPPATTETTTTSTGDNCEFVTHYSTQETCNDNKGIWCNDGTSNYCLESEYKSGFIDYYGCDVRETCIVQGTQEVDVKYGATPQNYYVKNLTLEEGVILHFIASSPAAPSGRSNDQSPSDFSKNIIYASESFIPMGGDSGIAIAGDCGGNDNDNCEVHGGDGGDGGAGGGKAQAGGDGYGACNLGHCDSAKNPIGGDGGLAGGRVMLHTIDFFMRPNAEISVNGTNGTNGNNGADNCRPESADACGDCQAGCIFDQVGEGSGGAGGGGGAGEITLFANQYNIDETAKLTAVGGIGGIAGTPGKDTGTTNDDGCPGASGGGGAAGEIFIFYMATESGITTANKANMIAGPGPGGDLPDPRYCQRIGDMAESIRNSLAGQDGQDCDGSCVHEPVRNSEIVDNGGQGCVNDEIDNDGDGFRDFEDTDCFSEEAAYQFGWDIFTVKGPYDYFDAPGKQDQDNSLDNNWDPFARDGYDGVCGDDDASCRARTCEEIATSSSCAFYGCEALAECVVDSYDLVHCDDIDYEYSCERVPYCNWYETTTTSYSTTDEDRQTTEILSGAEATAPRVPAVTGMLTSGTIEFDENGNPILEEYVAECRFDLSYPNYNPHIETNAGARSDWWQTNKCDVVTDYSCRSTFGCNWVDDNFDGPYCETPSNVIGTYTDELQTLHENCEDVSQIDCKGMCIQDETTGQGDAGSVVMKEYIDADGNPEDQVRFYCNKDDYNNKIAYTYVGGSSWRWWWSQHQANRLLLHTYGQPVDYISNGAQWYSCNEADARHNNVIAPLSTFPYAESDASRYCSEVPADFDIIESSEELNMEFYNYIFATEWLCNQIASTESQMLNGYASYIVNAFPDNISTVASILEGRTIGCCYRTGITSPSSLSSIQSNIDFVTPDYGICSALTCQYDFANIPPEEGTTTTSGSGSTSIGNKDDLFGERLQFIAYASTCEQLEGPNGQPAEVCADNERCVSYTDSSYEIVLDATEGTCCVGGYCQAVATASCEQLGGYLFDEARYGDLYRCIGDTVTMPGCCIGKIDVLENATDIYRRYPENQSFICYEGANEVSMFAECCGPKDCKNIETWKTRDQVYAGLGAENGRVFTKGTQLHTIRSFDYIDANTGEFIDGFLNLTQPVNQDAENQTSSSWDFELNEGYQFDWTEYDSLSFDLRYYGGYDLDAIVFDQTLLPEGDGELPPIPLKEYSLIMPTTINNKELLPRYIWHHITIPFSDLIVDTSMTVRELLDIQHPTVDYSYASEVSLNQSVQFGEQRTINFFEDELEYFPITVTVVNNLTSSGTIGDYLSSGVISSFHFTLNNPNPSLGANVIIQMDNLVLHKDNENDNYYCSGEFKTWLDDLVASDEDSDGLIDFEEAAPEMIACNMQLSYRWTGTSCCGAMSERPAIGNWNNADYYTKGEYYTDEQGGCWGGVGITEDQIVPQAYGGNYDAWPHLLYKEDPQNPGKNKFWSCNTTMTPFVDAYDRSYATLSQGQTTFNFTAEVTGNDYSSVQDERCPCDKNETQADCSSIYVVDSMTKNSCLDVHTVNGEDYTASNYEQQVLPNMESISILPPFSILGSWYCDPDGTWRVADQLKPVKVLATKMYEMAGDNFTLHCDDFSLSDLASLNSTSINALDSSTGAVSSDIVTACVLNNRTDDVSSVYVGIPFPKQDDDAVNSQNINDFIASLYQTFEPLNNTPLDVYQMPNCAFYTVGGVNLAMPDTLNLDDQYQDFFMECSGSHTNHLQISYNKPLNILLLSIDQPIEKGFIPRTWEIFRDFFKNLFIDRDTERQSVTATTIPLDLNYQADFSHLYIAKDGDAQIIGIMELDEHESQWYVRVDYEEFGASVEPLLAGYYALGLGPENSRVCAVESDQTIFITLAEDDPITPEFDWRYLTSNLRLVDIGTGDNFTSDPACWLHNGVADGAVGEQCDDTLLEPRIIADSLVEVPDDCYRCVDGTLDNSLCGFTHYVLFATTAKVQGDFGGVPQADAFCAAEAVVAYENGNSAYAKHAGATAILSIPTLNAKDRFNNSLPVRLSNPDALYYNLGTVGELFPETGDGFAIPSLPSFLYDVSGAVISINAFFWTGTNNNGYYRTPNCNNWQSASYLDWGVGGGNTPTQPGDWIQYSHFSCTSQAGFLCMVPAGGTLPQSVCTTHADCAVTEICANNVCMESCIDPDNTNLNPGSGAAILDKESLYTQTAPTTLNFATGEYSVVDTDYCAPDGRFSEHFCAPHFAYDNHFGLSYWITDCPYSMPCTDGMCERPSAEVDCSDGFDDDGDGLIDADDFDDCLPALPSDPPSIPS